MNPNFKSQYRQAKELGAEDEEIYNTLKEHPEYAEKIQQMEAQGLSKSDLFDFLSQDEPKPEKTWGDTITEHATSAARIPMQAFIGGVQAAALPYDLAVGGTTALYNKLPDTPSSFGAGEMFEDIPKKSKEKLPDLTTGGIFKAIGDYIGVDVEPQSWQEQTLRLTSLLTGFGAGPKIIEQGITKQASKILSPSVAEYVGKTASNLPLATAAISAENIYGVPELATFTAAAIARPIYEAAKFGTNLLVKEFVNRSPGLARKYLLWDPKKMSKGEFDKLLKNNHEEALNIAKKNVEEGIFTPQEYENLKPYLETAYEYGIPVNPSAVSKSSYFLDVEKNITENRLTEESAQAFRQKSAEQWADSYLKAIEGMSKNLAYEEQGAVVDAMKTDVTTKVETQLGEAATKSYDKSRQLFKGAKPVSNEGIAEINASLDEVIDSVGESLFETSAQKATKGIAEEAKGKLTQSPKEAGKPYFQGFQFKVGNVEEALTEQSQKAIVERPGQKAIMQAEGREIAAKEATKEEMRKAELLKEKMFGDEAKNVIITKDGKIRFKRNITPDELVNSIKSLNSSINWDNPEIVNLLKEPRKTIKKVLEGEYGKTHGEALSEYNKANGFWGKRSELFAKDARFKKWGVKADTLPEDLLKQLGTVDRFKAFEKEFGGTAQGKDLIDHLKYLKVRDELSKGFSKMEYDPGKIANYIHNVEKNPMMKFLMTPEVKTNLNKLKELDKFMFRRAKQFYESKTPDKGNKIIEAWVKMKPIVFMRTKAKEAIETRLSQVYSKILMDPAVTKEYIRIGESMVKASEAGSEAGVNKSTAEAQSLWNSLWESAAIEAPASIEKAKKSFKQTSKASAATLLNEE